MGENRCHFFCLFNSSLVLSSNSYFVMNFVKTMRDYQENFERAIRIDWERMKRRVFEELGQYKPSLRTSGMDTASYIGTPYAQRVLTTPGGMTPARAPV